MTIEQAVGDCVELVSGGAHVVEHQDVAPACTGRVGDVQDLTEDCGGRVRFLQGSFRPTFPLPVS